MTASEITGDKMNNANLKLQIIDQRLIYWGSITPIEIKEIFKNLLLQDLFLNIALYTNINVYSLIRKIWFKNKVQHM